jgi:predicted nucleic acid-binding protein
LFLHDLSAPEIDRTATLMDKYGDVPMDLADASLVAAAESLSHRRIFTLDRHFHIYRLANRSVLETVPNLAFE